MGKGFYSLRSRETLWTEILFGVFLILINFLMFLSLVLRQVTRCCSKVATYFTRIFHVQVQVLIVQSQTAFPRGFVLAVNDSAIVHYPAVSNNLVVLHIWQEWGLEVTNVHKRKHILYWTPYFKAQDWQFGFGSKPFQKCPQPNCAGEKWNKYVSFLKFIMSSPFWQNNAQWLTRGGQKILTQFSSTLSIQVIWLETIWFN